MVTKKDFIRASGETQKPVVLAIGGLDPSGGAGITLDARAIARTGCHPATIAAVLTRQTGNRFAASFPLPGEGLEASASLLIDDLDVGAVKVGAIQTLDNVEAVCRIHERAPRLPIVLDPVIQSSTGGRLLDDGALPALRTRLMNKLTLITPNLREAEILTGTAIPSPSKMIDAAKILLDMGANAVLVKGGHLCGNVCTDIFVDTRGAQHRFENARVTAHDIRGTGCALASFIAGALAKGHTLPKAIAEAEVLLQEAIANASAIGPGVYALDFGCARKRFSASATS